MVVLVVATALIAAVELLHDAVIDHKQVQVLLGDLEGHAAELHGAQLQAISAGEITPETESTVARGRRDLRATLAQLEGMDLRTGDYARR